MADTVSVTTVPAGAAGDTGAAELSIAVGTAATTIVAAAPATATITAAHRAAAKSTTKDVAGNALNVTPKALCLTTPSA
jgi:hypothetical protein